MRLARLTGALLLITPFLPLARWSGEATASELKYAFGPGDWLLALFIVAALAWVLAALFDRAPVRERGAAFVRAIARVHPLLWILFIAAAVATGTFMLFAGKPHLVDAIVQLMQAKIFAAGMVAPPVPSPAGFFIGQNMLIDGGRWYSQYAPGHSLVLAAGYLGGAPWLPGVVLSAAAAYLVYRFTAKAYDERHARLTLLLFVCSFFFLAMGGSYMNHTTALFCMAAGLYSLERWLATSGLRWAICAGAALGFGAATRSLEFIAVALALGPMAIPLLRTRRGITGMLASAAAAVVTISPYFVYNRMTTGDALLPGFIKLWGKAHDLGFHESPWGESHTPFRGVLNQLINLSLLNEYLFESFVPVVALLGAACLAGLLGRKWDRWLLLGFLAQPLAYVFYWHRDSFLGPRYLYATLPFLMPLLARAFIEIWSWADGRSLGINGVVKPVRARAFLAATAVVSFAYSLFAGVPMRAAIYSGSFANMKRDLAAEASAAGIDNAIVFVSVSWGGRLISNLRELGAPAALIEQAYRKTDHCQLHDLVQQALRERSTPAQVSEALTALVERSSPVKKVPLNDDPTLRFAIDRPLPLPERCAAEITRDREGYVVYEPHLLNNVVPIERSPIIFARDLAERDGELRELYPDRAAYRYDGRTFTKLP